MGENYTITFQLKCLSLWFSQAKLTMSLIKTSYLESIVGEKLKGLSQNEKGEAETSVNFSWQLKGTVWLDLFLHFLDSGQI